MNFLDRLPYNRLILICLLPFLFCALFNFGFFASDEYWTGITRYIPAQTSSMAHLIGPDDVKSPSQILPFHAMAQLALKSGIDQPFEQYKFMLRILGVLSMIVLFGAFAMWPMSLRLRKTAFFLLAFDPITAIAFTRPMFEALSAPFVAAAAVAAVWYERRPRFRYLAIGAALSTIAFLLRPQTGVIALTFVLMPLWKKSWRDFFGICGVGLVCFVVAGWIDQLLTGEFHQSLKRVLFYNVEHGADYGAQPFWFFLPLIFFAGFGLWTTKSYFVQKVRDTVVREKSILVMLALFIGLHSLFANKFERFLIPVLPLIIFLIAPAILDLFDNARARFRRVSFLVLNCVALACAVFFEPQRPLLELVRFANAEPNLASFVSLDETITWYPSVFQNHSVGLRNVAEGKVAELNCHEVLVVHSPKAAAILKNNPNLHSVRSIEPGPIDWLAFKMNPSHNERRAPLELLGCDGIKDGQITLIL